MDISILIVSWNVRDLLRSCLWSVAGAHKSLTTTHSPLSTEIIVVDNASTDGTAQMLRDEFPQTRVLVNSQNLGFTRGNNQALALASGRYLFLLNPDTELAPNTLTNLTAYADAHPRVGVIGPKLLNTNGSRQSSRRRFPTLATAFLESTLLQQWFPRNRVLTRFYMFDTNDDATQEADWVSGAAMFVRRELYDQVGGFDEQFFMYSEEVDWCHRAHDAGWQIVYLPTAQVTHHIGKSSDQAVAARHIHANTSRVRYIRKYYGAFAAEILRAYLLATFWYQIAEEGLKCLLGHKRGLRAQRIKAYWQVLRSELK